MDYTHLLRSVPIFAQLSDAHLGLLATSLGTRRFERGTTIFCQGSDGDELYIVVSGQVRIYTVSEVGQDSLSMWGSCWRVCSRLPCWCQPRR